MNAEVSTVRREVVAHAPPQVVAPADSRVRVLQLGPGLGVRGGVSSVEQLLPDIAPVLYGQSAGMVKAIRPAGEVMRSICEAAERRLAGARLTG